MAITRRERRVHSSHVVNAGERWQPGDLVRIRTERWTVLRQTTYGSVSALDVRGTDAANRGRSTRFLLPFEPVDSIVTSRLPRVVRPARWRALARGVLAGATPRADALRIAARSRFEVMPYQLEPALAVMRGVGCRVLIADEVGLGKTVQAGLIIAELLARRPDARALVVCPAGLRTQWADELSRRFQLSATLLDTAGLARVAADIDAATNPWAVCGLVITSIDFIKRPEVMRAVEGLVWDIVVFDEAHNLATRSDRATAAAALAWRARTLVMLSATPHSGDDAAFSRLCSLGDASGRFPLVFFRRTRADAGVSASRRTTWLTIRPSLAETRMLDALIEYARRVWNTASAANAARLAMSVLLRRAASSPGSLVRSIERRLQALDTGPDPGMEQLSLPLLDAGGSDEEPSLALAGAGLADAADERHRLEQVLALARLAAVRESKIAALARWARRVHEPVLVFTEYRDTLIRLKQALAVEGFAADDIAELHGGLTSGERRAAAASFVAGSARVLLATDAASEGLNLHRRCRCVISLEIPWSPVRLEQRIGRVDRIGQRRRVHAINLVGADTPETTTVRRLVEREQRAAATLRGETTSELSTADVILNGIDLPDGPLPVELPSALRRPDLAAIASAEAEWIVTARRLAPASDAPGIRPFVCAFRRAPKRLVWVTALTLCGDAGDDVWTAFVALDMPVAEQIRSRRDTASALAARNTAVVIVAHDLTKTLTEIASAGVRQADRVAADRERAICAAVRRHHARIAADLLQPGLFDRRADRRAASQAGVLEEALAQCQSRLDDLAHRAELEINAPVLRFAAFV